MLPEFRFSFQVQTQGCRLVVKMQSTEETQWEKMHESYPELRSNSCHIPACILRLFSKPWLHQPFLGVFLELTIIIGGVNDEGTATDDHAHTV